MKKRVSGKTLPHFVFHFLASPSFPLHFPCFLSREIRAFMRQNIEDPDIAACAERMTITKDDKKTLYLWTFLPEPCTTKLPVMNDG